MIEKIKDISPFEWLLIEVICFALVWLKSPYIGHLLTFILCPIILAILVISLIADKLDRSKIGRNYYISLILLFIGPIVVYIVFKFLGIGSIEIKK